MPPGAFERAVEFAQANDLILVHDNAYSEVCFDGYEAPSFLETPGAKDVGVEIFSLSKGWNMTGWRCAFVVGNGEVVERFRQLKANLDSGMFEALQRAATVALTTERRFPREMSEVYRRRRDLLVDALAAIGVSVEPPRATPYLWVPVPEGHDSASFTSLVLEEANVVVSPGPGYGASGEGFVRLSMTVSDEALEEAVRRIEGSTAESHNQGVTTRRPESRSSVEPERGFILSVLAPGADESRELGEIAELARTAGVEPVASLIQHRARPDPRTFVGKGKLVELKEAYKTAGAESLLVDHELSPSQQRKLEDELKARVVDRTQLILDIFAQHAHSAEGKLQVELAQLEYNLPRMRGMWQHLERLGAGRMDGGVGTRGPGETQLETDRRLARRRVAILRRRLQSLGRQRQTRRRERLRSHTPTVALAGYTNAGKSTLLNALTGAGVSVDDRLFETLDPTTRAFEEDGRRYLVTDTVGFIRRLPHELVEGFAATLEETLEADLILHVVDGSMPDEELDETTSAVNEVLAEIGADELPVELVLNKIDTVDPLGRRRLANRFPGSLQISAETGEGLDELKARIAERFAERFELVRMLVPYEDGAKLAELYSLGPPIDERVDGPDGVFIRARLPRRETQRLRRI